MSSKVKFLSFNLVSQDATIITANTENAFFLTGNLKDPRTTKKFRTTGTSAAVVFDFISAETINTVAIKGDKYLGFGFNGDLTIELNATDSWGSPAFSTTITPNPTHNIGYVTFTNQEYRFARITCSGTSYVELSNIFIGEYVQMAENSIDFGWTYINVDQTTVSKNKEGQKFFNEKPFVKRITANLNLLNQVEFTTISDMYNYHGNSVPIWFVIDEAESFSDTQERFIDQYYFVNDLAFKNSSFSLWDTSFTLEEVI